MSSAIQKWVASAGLAPLLVTFSALAAPPSALPDAVTKAPDETTLSDKREKLQAEVLKLLKKLGEQPPLPYPPPTPVVPPKKVETTPGIIVDEIKAAMNRFRDNDIETAKRTFQLIDPTTLSNEDRAFVRYMLACCHRRLGNLSEAETLYREVANSPDDAFFASCAIWQLALIRSEKELQTQLEQLRSRLKSK
ncbi:MAG: hypothetical protein RMJ56_17580 [Gemmataceae bacterium]|nr:hypothetical protein [Gemmata sp.]MDW8199409.1 hypothetical protein [Gemmataceae bacterium]